MPIKAVQIDLKCNEMGIVRCTQRCQAGTLWTVEEAAGTELEKLLAVRSRNASQGKVVASHSYFDHVYLGTGPIHVIPHGRNAPLGEEGPPHGPLACSHTRPLVMPFLRKRQSCNWPCPHGYFIWPLPVGLWACTVWGCVSHASMTGPEFSGNTYFLHKEKCKLLKRNKPVYFMKERL